MLSLPQIRAVVAQGPHPAGPTTGATSRATQAAKTRLAHATHPKLVRYIPRLAGRLGIKKA